jgi:hypothetical protein
MERARGNGKIDIAEQFVVAIALSDFLERYHIPSAGFAG